MNIRKALESDPNMNRPYGKHDVLLGRDLTPAERMERVRKTIEWTHRLLDQIDHTLAHLPEDLGSDLDDENERLYAFAHAVNQIYRATENAAFLGSYNWVPRKLYEVSWTSEEGVVIE